MVLVGSFCVDQAAGVSSVHFMSSIRVSSCIRVISSRGFFSCMFSSLRFMCDPKGPGRRLRRRQGRILCVSYEVSVLHVRFCLRCEISVFMWDFCVPYFCVPYCVPCLCCLCAISVFHVRFLCFVWDFCVPCKISVFHVRFLWSMFHVIFMCFIWDFCVPCGISVFHVGLFSLFFESQKIYRPFHFMCGQTMLIYDILV